MELTELIQDYFKSTRFMQIATVKNGQPWICTVQFTTDTDMNIYWLSNKNRRHSLEILEDPNVAVAIVKSTHPKQALQITGTAELISASNSKTIHTLYEAKLGQMPGLLDVVSKDLPEGPAYWKVTPQLISLWDEGNFPDAPKQEYRPH